MNSVKTGIYRHFKRGEFYRVIGIARHSETLEEMVVYQGLYRHPKYRESALWIRPLSMFSEQVLVEGKLVPRFGYIGPDESSAF